MVQWWLWQRRYTSKARIVLDTDDWEQAWNAINHYGWTTEKFLTWQEEWGIRHAHGITVASRWLAQKVATVAPTIPTLYLPNGVDALITPAAPAPAQASHAPRILFFTRFVEVSPKWLVEFWAEMLRLAPAAELLIAGTPVQPWLAEPFHHALSRAPQIQWLGYVPTAKLGDLYARSSCAIFPAMPVPLLQAKCSVRLATTLLHGVPVIASAVGEHNSYGAEGAATLVHADATPQQFAHAVANQLHERVQPAARHATTEQLLARYAWSRLVAPLPAFYESLLRQR
jgi:glycosyltransferase involved in cell wall biosynthesis